MTARALLRYSLILTSLFIATLSAHAQCSDWCLTSLTVSPTSLSGDGSEFANATATIYVAPSGNPPQVVPIYTSEQQFGSNQFTCKGGGQPFAGPSGPACDFPVAVGNNTVQFEFGALNSGSTSQNGTLLVTSGDYPNWDYSIPITVLPVSSYQEPPNNDTGAGGPCDCSVNGAPSGAQPINFANGNTWITQQDYFMPGVAGGLTLARTWNSLWAAASPPEESGIFGDSWRSSFEERIQTLTSQVKYWRGDGSALFYNYNSATGTYYLAAPIDDQTALAFNGTTNVWTVTLKNGTRKMFNSAGYLTSIVDLNGNTTTINIDASNQNRISSITDASGHVLTFNYANATFPRLCTSIMDSTGTFSQYSYDSLGRLTQVAFPDGSQYNFQYSDPNSNTLISKVTDSVGKTIEAHSYDSQRRGVTAQQANDSTGHPVNQVTVAYYTPYLQANQVLVYDSLGNSSTLTIRNVAQKHYLIAEGDACATCSYLMNASAGLSSSGYKTVFTDGNRNMTFLAYDAQGDLTSKALPDGDFLTGVTGANTWTYTYNSLGQVLTATDPLSHTTTSVYDSNGNLTSVTTPSPDGTTAASVTTFTPNAQGQITQIQDPLGNKTAITYCTQNQTSCPYGLIYSVTDANSHETTYSYDGRGNRLSVTDALNNETQFQYDAMNRVTQITYPTSPATTVQFHYDWRGRRDYVIDQNGNKTSYGYDDADRLISVTDAQTPTAGVTTYKYDTENNLTDIYDASNNHTRFYYNAHHQLQQSTFPSGYYETYVWDNNNNLTSKGDRNGNTTYYYYDYQNHLYEKRYPDYSTVNYSYDGARRLTQVSDATGTYAFVYDNMNRLTEADTAYAFLTGTKAIKYGYDAASNRTLMTDPQNLVTAYTFDTLNHLNALAFNGQNPGFGLGYDALSRRTSLTRPNGAITSYTYDPVSRLTSILHQLGTTTLDGATYTYDGAGNRTSKTNLLNNITENYNYDPIYQLLQVTQGSSTTERYTYDLVGNRLSSLGVSPYQYNSSNELLSTPTISYTYDKNGNTKTKSDGTQYSWDFENRLTQVVLPGSGGTVNFKYDPFGRRVQKSFTQGSTTTNTNYLYDWANLIEELDNGGNVLARYAQVGIDDPLSELRSGTTSYYEQDSLSSVTSLSNSSGALVNTYSYDSYGNSTMSTGTIINPFRFTGREFDSETGIHEYRARYYDETIGRFVSEDPSSPNEGPNLYAYVYNNPTGSIDPTGLYTIDKSCQGKCLSVGGGGPNNPNQMPHQVNLADLIRQGADNACANSYAITDLKLRRCIQKSCNQGKIKCDCGSNEGGFNNKVPLLTNRTAHLCFKDWPNWTDPAYAATWYGQAAVHEWAHGCGWNHNHPGNVPFPSGSYD